MSIPPKPGSRRNTYNSSGYVVRVAEPALMQLCLAAMEAYVVGNCEFRGNPAGDSDLMSATVPI